MRRNSTFRRVAKSAGALAVGLGLCLSAVLPAQSSEWPERPINMVVGFGVGGSADRTARAVASFLPDSLGQPVVVMNRPGAGGQLGAAFTLARPADGYTIFVSAISPYIATSILVGGADYTLDDFAFINGQWTDWDLIAVNKDTPYQSLTELLDAIRDNPGEIKVSLVFGSSGHLTTLLLLDAAGIPHDNLNLVNYDSGGAARTAVAGGQVDFTILGAEGSDGVRDFIRPLAVVREDRHESWDAPPVNEALAAIGAEVPIMLGSVRGMAVSAEFRDAHPDRYQKLVDAYQEILEREDVQRYMARSGVGAEWLGPERTTQRVQTMYEVFERYKDVLEN